MKTSRRTPASVAAFFSCALCLYLHGSKLDMFQATSRCPPAPVCFSGCTALTVGHSARPGEQQRHLRAAALPTQGGRGVRMLPRAGSGERADFQQHPSHRGAGRVRQVRPPGSHGRLPARPAHATPL